MSNMVLRDASAGSLILKAKATTTSTSVQRKSLGIGQGPEPQLVVKATQSATVVSASHLSFSARTQHADSTVHNDTHNKYNILHNATMSVSSLPV